MSTQRRPRRVRVAMLLLAPAVLVAPLFVPGAAAAVPAGAAATPVAPTSSPSAPCTTPSGPDDVVCMSVVSARPAVRAATATGPVGSDAAVPDGVTPAQLQAIYGVSGLTAPAGTTVGVVVPYDAPNVEADLATFRSTYGLPPCTSANGCFRKVDERGVTVPAGKATTSTTPPVYGNSTWEAEATLDVQAVSAVCPSCRILLVEADDTSLTASLGPATVMAQTLGAAVVSNSFAAVESKDAVAADAGYWSKVTVPVFAGSGDRAFYNEGNPNPLLHEIGYYPATSPSVIAVGGTSATVSGNAVSGPEVPWLANSTDPTKVYGTGSGCSKLFARPAYQVGYFGAKGYLPDTDTYCGTADSAAPVQNVPARASPDLSALADPSPGFPLVLDGGWTIAGGTSLSVQLVAAVAAYAGMRAPGTPVSTVMYGLAARGLSTGLQDLTQGTNVPNGGQGCSGNAVCVARSGWDGPTGLGTPRGLSVFAPLLSISPTVTLPGAEVTASGSNFVPGETVTITAADGSVLGTAVVAPDGTYSEPVTVPGNDPSPVAFTVTGSISGFTATQSVAIPAVTLTPSTAGDTAVVPQEQVTATLTNFAANEPVTVSVPGGATVDVQTDAGGGGTTTVTVPLGTTGTFTVTATGPTSGSYTATIPVAVPTLTPSFQQVVAGRPVTLQATGFGAGENLSTVVPGGAVLPPTPTSGDGSATLTWTASTPLGTGLVTVTGVTTGLSDTAAVDLVTSASAVPAPPTVLSVVPTTAGGLLVGIRAASTGPATTSVTVLTSTGLLGTRVAVGPGGDAFVSVPSVPSGGPALTVQALAGNSAGDSLPSTASVPVVPNTADGTGDLTPVGPVRIADTRQSGGPFAGGALGPGSSRVLPVAGRAGIPATGVSAVVLSVTVVVPTAPTYLTLWPSGEARPVVSNANVAAGRVETSLVKVKLGSDGGVAVYNDSGSTDVVVDLLGYYAAAGSGGNPSLFAHNQSYAPGAGTLRIADTRTLANPAVRAPAGGQVVVPVRGRAGVPADATAVEVQVQAVGAVAQGYLTVYPTGSARPVVSQVLYDSGRPGITAVVATLGPDGSVTVYASAGTDVIVDVVGYYAPSATGRFVPVSPRRYLDTRVAGAGPQVPSTAPRSVQLAGGTALDGSQQVPTSATSVAFQLTSVSNTVSAFVTAWPAGTTRPFVTSLLPDPPNATYDNLVLSAVGRTNGAVSLYVNNGATDFVLDVQGYFTATPPSGS